MQTKFEVKSPARSWCHPSHLLFSTSSRFFQLCNDVLICKYFPFRNLTKQTECVGEQKAGESASLEEKTFLLLLIQSVTSTFFSIHSKLFGFQVYEVCKFRPRKRQRSLKSRRKIVFRGKGKFVGSTQNYIDKIFVNVVTCCRISLAVLLSGYHLILAKFCWTLHQSFLACLLTKLFGWLNCGSNFETEHIFSPLGEVDVEANYLKHQKKN